MPSPWEERKGAGLSLRNSKGYSDNTFSLLNLLCLLFNTSLFTFFSNLSKFLPICPVKVIHRGQSGVNKASLITEAQ